MSVRFDENKKKWVEVNDYLESEAEIILRSFRAQFNEVERLPQYEDDVWRLVIMADSNIYKFHMDDDL